MIFSVRALARATNLSKSSVHRLRQRIKRRHQEPESNFWETPEGSRSALRFGERPTDGLLPELTSVFFPNKVHIRHLQHTYL